MLPKAYLSRLVGLLGILIGIGYSWPQLTDTDSIASVSSSDPVACATQLWLVHTGTSGYPDYELKAPLAVYYSLNNHVVLTKPVFTSFLNQSERWQLCAHHGRLQRNQALLQLWGDVKLKQSLPPPKVIFTLSTSLLNIDLKARVATTPKLVTWVQANQHLSGVGMRADMVAKTVQLLSKVQAQLTD